MHRLFKNPIAQQLKKYLLCILFFVLLTSICGTSFLLWSYVLPLWGVVLWHTAIGVLLFRLILRDSVFPGSLLIWKLNFQNGFSRYLNRQMRKKMHILSRFVRIIEASSAPAGTGSNQTVTSNLLIQASYAFSGLCWTAESLESLLHFSRRISAEGDVGETGCATPGHLDIENSSVMLSNLPAPSTGRRARYFPLHVASEKRTLYQRAEGQGSPRSVQKLTLKALRYSTAIFRMCIHRVAKEVDSLENAHNASIDTLINYLRFFLSYLEATRVVVPAEFGIPKTASAKKNFQPVMPPATPDESVQYPHPRASSTHQSTCPIARNSRSTGSTEATKAHGKGMSKYHTWKLSDLLWEVYLRHKAVACHGLQEADAFRSLCSLVCTHMAADTLADGHVGAPESAPPVRRCSNLDKCITRSQALCNSESRRQTGYFNYIAKMMYKPILGSLDFLRVSLLVKYHGIQFWVPTRDGTRQDAVFLPCPAARNARSLISQRLGACGWEDAQASGGNRARSLSHDSTPASPEYVRRDHPTWNWGPAVIFFNPNAVVYESCAYDNAWIDFYLAENANVVLVNYRGFGRSEGTPTPEYLLRDAEDLVEFLTATTLPKRDKRFCQPPFGVGLRCLGVHGRSVGGLAAIHVAWKFPNRIKWLYADRTFKALEAAAAALMGSWAQVALQLGGFTADNVHKYSAIRSIVKVISWDPEDGVIFDAASLKAGVCESFLPVTSRKSEVLWRQALTRFIPFQRPCAAASATAAAAADVDANRSPLLLLALFDPQQLSVVVDELLCLITLCQYLRGELCVSDTGAREFSLRFRQAVLRHVGRECADPELRQTSLEYVRHIICRVTAHVQKLGWLLTTLKSCGVSVVETLLSALPENDSREVAFLHFLISLQLWGSLTSLVNLPDVLNAVPEEQPLVRAPELKPTVDKRPLFDPLKGDPSMFLSVARCQARTLCERVARGFQDVHHAMNGKKVSQCSLSAEASPDLFIQAKTNEPVLPAASSLPSSLQDDDILSAFVGIIGHLTSFFVTLCSHLQQIEAKLEDYRPPAEKSQLQHIQEVQPNTPHRFDLTIIPVDASYQAIGFIVPLHCGHNGNFTQAEGDATRFYFGMSGLYHATTD